MYACRAPSPRLRRDYTRRIEAQRIAELEQGKAALRRRLPNGKGPCAPSSASAGRTFTVFQKMHPAERIADDDRFARLQCPPSADYTSTLVLRKFTGERMPVGHAARRARRYSWCRPPRIGVAITSDVFGKAMTGGRELIRVGHRLWNARSQAGVWTTSIVVGHPFTKNAPEMSLVHRDQPIETLPTYRADQSLAERVRLRRPRGRLQHMPSHRAMA